MMTERNKVALSNGSNSILGESKSPLSQRTAIESFLATHSKGLPMIQPRITEKGMTKSLMKRWHQCCNQSDRPYSIPFPDSRNLNRRPDGNRDRQVKLVLVGTHDGGPVFLRAKPDQSRHRAYHSASRAHSGISNLSNRTITRQRVTHNQRLKRTDDRQQDQSNPLLRKAWVRFDKSVDRVDELRGSIFRRQSSISTC